MQTIVGYAEKEMQTLEKKPFNPVDSLVLSQLSYLNFRSLVSDDPESRLPVPMKELLKAEYFEEILEGVWDKINNKKLLFAVAASPRFRDIRVGIYVDEIDVKQEKQFSAITFFLNEETAYIAFRGTDATIVGWKEDFNMAFMSPVPSQQDALRYVTVVAQHFTGQLLIGGHSKGGNLAVYAAMMCEPSIQDRIIRIYSHDGPGFKDKVFESEEYNRIRGRIQKTLPQSSLIGMLLENQEEYAVIKSNRVGFLQHDPFSWSVRDDNFVIVKHLSSSAQYFNKTLHDWLEGISPEEREECIDALFSVLQASNTSTVFEFGEQWQTNIPLLLKAAKNMDPKTKKFVFQTLKSLAVMAVKNLRQHSKPVGK